MIETVDLVLTGARAGKTVNINGKQFVNGVVRLRGSREQLEPVLSYYGRAYAAFAAGSEALKLHQERDKAHGQHQVDAPGKPGSADGLERSGANANAGGDKASASAAHHGGHHGVEAGGSGLRSAGPGHADAGLPAGQGSNEQQSNAHGDLTVIRAAVLSLDPSVAEQWNAEGRPAVEAVAAVLNDQSISRKQIDAAAGDLNREQVAEHRKKLAT